VLGSFTFVGGLVTGRVCADTHLVCRPVPWYQIGKNGDDFSLSGGGGRPSCLRIGVRCVDARITSTTREEGVAIFFVAFSPRAVRTYLCVGGVLFQESSDRP